MIHYKEIFKLNIKSQEARPTPPIGPMLGQRGLNIKEFCDNYNNLSKKFKKSVLINTEVLIEKNNKFSINPLNSVITDIIKNASENKEISIKVIYELSVSLQKDDDRFKNLKLISIVNTLIGSTKSMRITII